jgi:hypothetical protein
MKGNWPDGPVGRVISPSSKLEAGFDARECMAIAAMGVRQSSGRRRNLRRRLDRSWP